MFLAFCLTPECDTGSHRKLLSVLDSSKRRFVLSVCSLPIGVNAWPISKRRFGLFFCGSVSWLYFCAGSDTVSDEMWWRLQARLLDPNW